MKTISCELGRRVQKSTDKKSRNWNYNADGKYQGYKDEHRSDTNSTNSDVEAVVNNEIINEVCSCKVMMHKNTTADKIKSDGHSYEN